MKRVKTGQYVLFERGDLLLFIPTLKALKRGEDNLTEFDADIVLNKRNFEVVRSNWE